jgi:cytochrome c oxidase assembly protein subunit 15
MTTASSAPRLLRLARVTLVAVYLLITVGGLVRSTGAGMGCPDWPTCFGRLVPPTSESQLPEGYQTAFVEQRRQKNARLASQLEAIGLDTLAEEVRHEEWTARETSFNAARTWTEYLNRLAGVTVGLLVLATFLMALRRRTVVATAPLWAGLALLATAFNGWAGSLVVSTHLLPWMVTVHMLLALLVVALLVVLVHRLEPRPAAPVPDRAPLNAVLLAALSCLVLQVALGTQVREGVDQAALGAGLPRAEWIGSLGAAFLVHRSFSWMVLVLHGGLILLLRQRVQPGHALRRRAVLLASVVGLEMVLGAVMAYAGMPPWAQPLHLGLAALLFGLQVDLLLKVNAAAYQPAASRAAAVAA